MKNIYKEAKLGKFYLGCSKIENQKIIEKLKSKGFRVNPNPHEDSSNLTWIYW